MSEGIIYLRRNVMSRRVVMTAHGVMCDISAARAECDLVARGVAWSVDLIGDRCSLDVGI